MNFFANHKLLEYLNKYTLKKRNEIITKNALKFIYNRITNNLELFSKEYIENKACYLRNTSAIFQLRNILKEFNMCPVFFKGIILSQQLYENPFDRMVADIDLIVPNSDIKEITKILKHKGFKLISENEFKNKHHWSFMHNGIVYELHLHVLNPTIGIDESFILSNIIEVDIHGNKVYTFNITATLLHLIYHLYMDTYLVYGNLYNVLANKSPNKANRFLYRAYEIALFSEKYFKQIKWDEIINDLKKQKLRVFFETMINDIIEIFPNTFPKSFIDAVNNMEYVIYEKDDLYKYIMDSNSLNKNIDAILSGYIDYQWNNRVYKNLQIDSVGRFTLDNPIIKDQEINNNYLLTCNVQVKKSENGIKLFFKVTNDDFYFSKAKDYDTLTSDGVHLIICGTEKYSYNSIFLFPKIVDDEIVVIPVNVLNSENSEISDLLISTSYQKFETEYIITAVLKKEFLKRNNIEKHFYLGVVISDCSSKTKKRKGELILSNPYNEWYNPVYFAKVNI